MNACQRAAVTVGQSAASGVLGWMLLLAAFEAAYWAGAYLAQRRRREGSC